MTRTTTTAVDRQCQHCGTIPSRTYVRCFIPDGEPVPRCPECLGNLNHLRNYL